jgi:pyruvate formate lyase activating enzyme
MIKIGGLQKTTLIDFPGRPAATVFLSGCNLRCPWCYSPELVLPQEIKNQPEISQKEFFEFLEGKKGLLDGVVVCGGEPSLNEDLPEFLAKIKNMGFLVKLDTNGTNPAMLQKIIGQKLVDYLAMDVKLPKEKYRETLGIDPEDIGESIATIKKSGIDYQFRTTVVPGIHNKEDILNIAKWLAPAKAYCLQNFRPEKTLDVKFREIKPFPEAFFKEIQKEISSLFENCQVR